MPTETTVSANGTHIVDANGRLPAGSPMFIPKKLNTIVGIDIIIVRTAKNFILKFKLFEMIDENDSIVPARTDV